MNAVFIELPAFARHRAAYLDDEAYSALQIAMMQHLEAGSVIEGTGGLRKLRYRDARRGKGGRGGLRLIYYWWLGGAEFWLFTLYSKDEMVDLGTADKKILRELLKAELRARK